MSSEPKNNTGEPKYKALVDMVQKLRSENVQRERDPDNRMQMRSADGETFNFSED